MLKRYTTKRFFMRMKGVKKANTNTEKGRGMYALKIKWGRHVRVEMEGENVKSAGKRSNERGVFALPRKGHMPDFPR